MMSVYTVYDFCSKYLIYVFLYLMMNFFKTRYTGKQHMRTLVIAVLVSSTLLNLLDHVWLNTLSYGWYTVAIALIGLPFILWYYEEAIWPKLLLEIIFLLFMTGTRVFSTNLLSLLQTISGVTLPGRLLFGILSDGISYLVLARLCLSLQKEKFRSAILQDREYILLICIGLFNLLCLFRLNASSMGISTEINDLVVTVLMNGCILLTSFILYWILFRYAAVRQQQKENELILENMESQEKYMDAVQEALSQYRGLRHEMKNTLFYVNELVKERQYDQLEDYLAVNLYKQDTITDVVDTGRPVISALLNQKKAYAGEYGIEMEVEASFASASGIDDLELCSILANLIDNAVRECKKIPSSHILVETRTVKNYLAIHVANTTRENVLKVNPKLVTTKKHGEDHGIGLKVVRSIAEKHDGMVNVKMEKDNVFAVDCMLKVG